jgi:exosortase
MSVPAISRSSIPRNLWQTVAIVAVVAFTYGTVLTKLGHDWWTDENYSHGLLIPFITGFIAWSQRDRLLAQTTRPATFWGLTAVVLALFSLWSGTAGAELYVQRTSLVLILAGTILYFWGFNILRLLLVPLFLLLLAIPIPAIVFNKIAFPLQLFASRCAVWTMSVFDIPVLRQGNVIELMPLGARETKKLEVVEACSGIRSLMTLVTLAVVFAYFTHPRGDSNDRSQGQEAGAGDRTGSSLKRFIAHLSSYGFWRSTIIFFSAVPIAIFTNAVRVSGTGILARYYGTKVADGFFHTFSGWVVYVVAFLLLFGVGWVLDRFKPATKATPKAARPASKIATAQLAAAEGGE